MAEGFQEIWTLKQVIRNLNRLFSNGSFPYGGFHRNVAAATTITVPGTYYKAAGTSTARDLNEFTHSDNRLTYTGELTRHFHVAVTTAFTTAGTNDVIGLAVAKNGTIDAGSKVRRFVGTGSDIGSTALHWDGMLATNEYIELWVTNESASATVTVDEFYFFAIGLGTQ